MKTLKATVVAAVMFVVFSAFSMTANAATPFLAPAIFGFGIGGLGYIAGTRDANGIPGECYNEPLRLVKWNNAPGYSFVVAGCDYQAKKANLTIVKVLKK